MRGRGRGRGERGRGLRGRGRGAANAAAREEWLAGTPAEESKEGQDQRPAKEKKAEVAPVEKKPAPQKSEPENMFAQMLAGPEKAAKQVAEIRAGVKKSARGPRPQK